MQEPACQHKMTADQNCPVVYRRKVPRKIWKWKLTENNGKEDKQTHKKMTNDMQTKCLKFKVKTHLREEYIAKNEGINSDWT